MHDIVSIWYVAARKFGFVVDSQVKIMVLYAVLPELSSNTLMPSTPFLYHFDNICIDSVLF